MSSNINVSVFCSKGFGDALIQMILANNLAKQAMNVRFYSDIATQLQPLVDAFEIWPLPNYEDLQEELREQHIVLYDSSAPYTKSMPRNIEDWFRSNAVCYRLSHDKPRHREIKLETLQARLPQEHASKAQMFLRLNATIRTKTRGWYRPAIVDQVVSFLSNEAKFTNVTNDNGIKLERGKVNNVKIVIHPTSSNPYKNWPREKYLDLAHGLHTKGFSPVFTVSPGERGEWLKLLEGSFEVPLFETLTDLAHFYLDARLFIGSDSGNGHLASYLGVPTIQLFRRYRAHPAWRAGWSQGSVLIGRMPYCLSKSQWHKGIAVKDVLNQVDKMLKVDQAAINQDV